MYVVRIWEKFDRPVHRFPSTRINIAGFGVFFEVKPNKLLKKQSSCRRFETPWHSCEIIAWVHRRFVMLVFSNQSPLIRFSIPPQPPYWALRTCVRLLPVDFQRATSLHLGSRLLHQTSYMTAVVSYDRKCPRLLAWRSPWLSCMRDCLSLRAVLRKPG